MGTWEWDLQTGLMIWSAGLERIFGLIPGSFEGTMEAVGRLIHPDDREPVLAALTEAAAGGREPHLEFRILRPDGGLRWVERLPSGERWHAREPGAGILRRAAVALLSHLPIEWLL